jgi:hypothetical protein
VTFVKEITSSLRGLLNNHGDNSANPKRERNAENWKRGPVTQLADKVLVRSLADLRGILFRADGSFFGSIFVIIVAQGSTLTRPLSSLRQ